MPTKKANDSRFNPEKYRTNFCHECQGLGKAFNEENSKEVCKACGGAFPYVQILRGSLLEKEVMKFW